MRAIIDIGTNSVRLLMAEKEEKGEWKPQKEKLEKVCQNPRASPATPGRGCRSHGKR